MSEHFIGIGLGVSGTLALIRPDGELVEVGDTPTLIAPAGLIQCRGP
jgi:hypothetical protein